jgi:valyl-tRNA synthetase
MEKEYNHKFVEKKWLLNQTIPDHPARSSLLFQYINSLPPDSRLDLQNLASLNRADTTQIKSRMQNRGLTPDNPVIPDPDQERPKRFSHKNEGEVIEIHKILENFGWDNFKFTLAIKADPDPELSVFLTRIKRIKAFTHKIWNASRYIIMNLHNDEDSSLEFDKITTTDKWLLHRLNNTVDQINHQMDQYQIPNAASTLYHFFWHEFCDWYLEFSKTDIRNRETRKVLKFSLLHLLQCLHPFIPFLTEEIHQKVNPGQGLLMTASFPQFNSNWVFLRDHSAIEQLKTLITRTRKIISENKINPVKPFSVYIRINSPGIKNEIAKNMKYYDFLTRSQKSEIVDDFSGLPGGFKAKTQNLEILLPLKNETERKQVLNKLKRDFEQTRARIFGVESKLADPQFISRESESGLSALKKSLLKSHQKREKIQKILSDLSEEDESQKIN